MKNSSFFIFIILAICLNANGQKIYYTRTYDVSFSGGNNGGFGGLAKDMDQIINNTNSWLEVYVNLVDSPRQALYWVLDNCWAKRIIFDQTNRYMEFRVKSDSAKLNPMICNNYGNCSSCCPEKKTWPGNTFTIPKSNKWTIVFLKIPPTTGGTQNVIDTVGNALGWFLDKGEYLFDYFKIGEAAIPPIPEINSVKDIKIYHNGTYNIPLSGISIPNRFLEGLTIKIDTKDSNNVIRKISLVDSFGNPFIINETATSTNAILRLIPDSTAGGMSDSIFITLTDTIRKTAFTRAFKVSVTDCVCDSTVNIALSDINENIKVYPNPSTGIVNLTGDNILRTEVFDITGSSQGSFNGKQLDLSKLNSGTFFLNIYGKDGLLKIEKIILTK